MTESEVRPTEINEIGPLRQQYREEANCQVIFDSIHVRPGWTQEYALEIGGELAGYGSLAVGGPWREKHTLYEFFVRRDHRMRTFELFTKLLESSGAVVIETQTNIPSLLVMLHVFARNVRSEAVLFADQFQSFLAPDGASFRAKEPGDAEALKRHELDDSVEWVATVDGEVAGAGDILYHYNRPYGDIYMKVAEPFRRRGIGAYLVQELKSVCRQGGSVPAARCNVDNLPSRATLQRAGFVPCGNLVSGELR